MASETAPSVGLLHLTHVRDFFSCKPPAYSYRWLWLVNAELDVKIIDTMVTGTGMVAHTLQWDWQPGDGRSYKNETYHMRVQERGSERWLEVINQVHMSYMHVNSFLA